MGVLNALRDMELQRLMLLEKDRPADTITSEIPVWPVFSLLRPRERRDNRDFDRDLLCLVEEKVRRSLLSDLVRLLPRSLC